MKKLLISVVLLSSLTACGDSDTPYVDANTRLWDANKDQVIQCIGDGGTPQYAADDFGRVRQYFGCVSND